MDGSTITNFCFYSCSYIWDTDQLLVFIESYEIDLLSCMRLQLLRFVFMLHANLFSEGYAVLGIGRFGNFRGRMGLVTLPSFLGFEGDDDNLRLFLMTIPRLVWTNEQKITFWQLLVDQ
jgi:hypothetical protein